MIVSKQNIKDWLNLSSYDENKYDHYRRICDSIIETIIDKNIITKKFVEYINGDNSNYILLKNYPVYKVESLYFDSARNFESSSLVETEDYFINDTTGEIELLTGGVFARSTKSIKVTYWAGFSKFEIVSGLNDMLDIKESGDTQSITIDEDEYNAEDLATEIETKLNANDDLTDGYTVKYLHDEMKFLISHTSVEFTIMAKTGSNKYTACYNIIGFNGSDDKTSSSYKLFSDVEINGVPRALINAGQQIILMLHELSAAGKNLQMVRSTPTGTDGALTTYIQKLPEMTKQILNTYKRAFL